MTRTALEITGATRLFGIFADPIAQVKTPQALNRLMAERGVDGVMVPFHVPPSGLAQLVSGLGSVPNFGGAIVTVPHKMAITALCDRLEPLAVQVGAANCIRRDPDGRFSGAILDGEGFLGGLLRSGIEPRGMSVFMVGAGGAASAIAFSLARAGVRRIAISNRTKARSDSLAKRLAASYPDLLIDTEPAAPADHDLVVNATALGMASGDPLPLDVTRLQPGQIVAEVVMVPEMTPLLVSAQKAGCRIHHGRPMLDCQLELMADFMGMR